MAKKRKYQRKHVTFLSGPIDALADHGVGWRDALQPQLEALGFFVINPIEENKKAFKVSDHHEIHRILARIEAEQGEEEFFRVFETNCVKKDLQGILDSDFITVYWDPATLTIGTIHEIVLAAEHNIPVYLICPKEKKSILFWLRYLIWKSNGKIFQTFEEYLEFISNL